MADLRASEAMFRYLFSRAGDGYVIIDKHEQVTYANAQARLYLGLGQESPIPAQTFKVLVERQYHCEPEAAWESWPQKSFAGDIVVPLYLVRPETPTANAFFLQVELLDIPAGLDEEAGRIVHLKDITERTRLQDRLKRFNALVSHKLRTPLVPLYSGLMFVARNIDSIPQQDVALFIQEAFEGAQRLYHEIEDIVRYLEAPVTASAGEGCRLSELKAIVDQISQELNLHAVNLHVEDNARQLTLSQQSIERILWEVLENAQKFHPKKSPTVDIHIVQGEERSLIQIKDDGVSLSPEQLALLWTPYYQADKFSTGQVEGMGLGLAMIATLVWSVGGACRAFNREDGPGLVIELELPSAVIPPP
ncbi:MAG: PAS domain-containing sensor histidine kinase [Thermoflexales bacterium]|nr:PAS domain-containing sensor histidine kinase [Thermoflexales bacterium]